MNLPGFSAESSLSKPRRSYRGKYLYGGLAQNQSGLAAMALPSQLEEMESLDDADDFDSIGNNEGENEEMGTDEMEVEG